MMQHHSYFWRLTCRGAVLCAACLMGANSQAQLVLPADADTGTEESQPDDIEGHKDRIQVRSNTTAGRQNVGYVRFDLAGVDLNDFNSAIFTLVRRNETGWADGQIQVYGLNDVPGNTPQDWDEFSGDDGMGNPTSGLNYNTSGAEIPGDGDATTQDLGTIGTSGTENLWALGDLPGIPTGGVLLTSDLDTLALFDFLNSRAGGLATLLIVNKEGTNRDLLFAPNEFGGGGFGPTLTLIPEPTSVTLALLSMAGFGLVARRRR